jgi:hypothetical protein
MSLNMNAAVNIRANVDGLQQIEGLRKGLGGLGQEAGKTSGFMNKLKTAAVGVGASLASAAVIRGIKQSADTFATYQADVKLLENGLKNLGGTAPAELDKLIQAADKLGKQTLFNEEDFNKGFGLLTSFTQISVGSYERVATAAADLAQTSGTSVSGAMMQLAKALNDPVAGLSALSRSGVQFTEQQKEMIKSMVAVGDVAGAQNVILSELEKQYGGNATAAAQGLAGAQDTLGESFVDLQKAIGELVEGPLVFLITGLTKVVSFIADQLIPAINNLPGPIKNTIGAFAALAIGIAAIAGPVLMVLPGITALLTILKGIAALKIGAIIAGWAGAIGPIIGVLLTLGKVLLAVFTGPVGWVALAVAAGVAIFKFRDQIGAAFKAIGDIFKKAAEGFYKIFVEPIIKRGQFVFDGLVQIFNRLAEALRAPFLAAANLVRGIVNQMLNGIGNAINAVVRAINNLIQGANRGLAALNLPQIPFVPQVPIPQFADGGMVSGPTLAMVGEGGEPEYIVPQSKASGFAANWMAGRRGAAAIPRFAEGGVVVPATSINIQTGPVLQQDGQRYVTINDLEGAMQTVVSTILGNGRTAGGRRFAGVR